MYLKLPPTVYDGIEQEGPGSKRRVRTEVESAKEEPKTRGMRQRGYVMYL